MNRVQELQFELMKEASFNGFDGDTVVTSLTDHPELWRAAYMTRLDDLICLRDLPAGHWNIDTLFILPVEGKEMDLVMLAGEWDADKVDWIGGKEACAMLGSYSRTQEAQKYAILRVWWD